MRNKVNIGTASIILIFIILCLAVFSLLSLSDAKSAEVFARRRADSVTAYYTADVKGQRLIAQVTAALKNGKTAEEAAGLISEQLSGSAPAAVSESGLLGFEIPMSAGQSLRVELDGRDAAVLSYYVYNREDYAIDSRLPVWTGEEE